MVSKINSSFLLVVLFNVLFFNLVLGDSSTGGSPTPATAWPPKPSVPASPPKPSAPASPPSALPRCNCSLDMKTTVACSVVLLQGGAPGIPRYMCCKGLRRLKEEDVYSCLCYILKSNLKENPLVNLTIPAAMQVVSLACSL